MRNLKASDIPAFCRCLKRIGIKDEVKRIANDSNTAEDAWNKGFDLIWNIFDLATEKKAEKEIYGFLANIFEVSEKELEEMPFDEFINGLKKIAEDNNLNSFFSFVSKSMI